MAENQIWEFSHQKFLRGRQDLLDDIKRKAMESDVRRDGADVSSHVTMLQSSQQDLAQQVTHLQANFGEVARELADTRRIQVAQQQLLKSLLDYIQKTNGGQRKFLVFSYAIIVVVINVGEERRGHLSVKRGTVTFAYWP